MQMTDTNLNTLITSFFGLLTAIVTAIVAIYLAKINRKTDETKDAAKVEEVKTALVGSDAKTDQKLNEIHSLVNSKFTTLLKTNAIALRRVANVSKDKDDEAAAVYAETALADHEKEMAKDDDSLKVEIVKIPKE
jgi:H+/gluconate symporter-like permease